MKKKFYIKKSPSDLIQEQNRLLRILLDKQDDKPKETVAVPSFSRSDFDYVHNVQSDIKTNSDIEDYAYNVDDGNNSDDDDIDGLYIPTTSNNSGKASLPSLDVEKKEFDDDDNIEKLRRKNVHVNKLD